MKIVFRPFFETNKREGPVAAHFLFRALVYVAALWHVRFAPSSRHR
jgi:hypothetical protein